MRSDWVNDVCQKKGAPNVAYHWLARRYRSVPTNSEFLTVSPMSSHIPFWCSQTVSAFCRINSSTGTPSTVGGRLILTILPFMKTYMNRSLLMAFSSRCWRVSFFFGFGIG